MDRYQRKAKKIYKSYDAERRVGTTRIRRVGTNRNEKKNSREESDRKAETYRAIIYGRRLHGGK